jgi:type I restriction enzyme S subunit
MVHNISLNRPIPEGWKVGSLLDIATYTNGIACQKYRPTSSDRLPVIKIKEMRDGYTDATEFVTANVPQKVRVENGDVLFSWSASLEVILWTGGTGALNQHIFKVTSRTHPRSFVYHELRNYLSHFKMLADLRKTTMGHITQEHLVQSRISLPPDSIIGNFDLLIDPILQAVITNHQQNQECSF